MQRIKVFIAGSTKEVAQERIIVLSAIAEWNSTQSLVDNSHAIEFQPFSYTNFPDSIGTDPSQAKYNIFIKEKCDLIIFILDGIVGDKTYDEFKIAYESLHGKRRAPRILVFSKVGTAITGNLLVIKNTLKDDVKYWIDYDSLDFLAYMVKEQLTKLEPEMKERHRQNRRHQYNRVFISICALIFVIILAIGIPLGIKYYHNTLVRKVEMNIVIIQSSPGLSGKKLKKETLEFLENNSFPQRDSLYEVVKSL